MRARTSQLHTHALNDMSTNTVSRRKPRTAAVVRGWMRIYRTRARVAPTHRVCASCFVVSAIEVGVWPLFVRAMWVCVAHARAGLHSGSCTAITSNHTKALTQDSVCSCFSRHRRQHTLKCACEQGECEWHAQRHFGCVSLSLSLHPFFKIKLSNFGQTVRFLLFLFVNTKIFASQYECSYVCHGQEILYLVDDVR